MKIGQEIEPYGHIISHLNSAYTSGWSFEMQRSPGTEDPKLFFRVTSRNGSLGHTETSVPFNTFVNVVGTSNGKVLMMYLNGEKVSEARLQDLYLNDPGTSIKVGSASYSVSTNRWSGVIDDIIFFDAALDETEVKNVHGLAPGDSQSTSRIEQVVDNRILGYWPLDGNAMDMSGNGGDGNVSTLLASMVFSPDGRLFVSEKNTGLIRIMKNGTLLEKPFATIPDTYVSWEQGLLGITIDPKFTENQFLYLYYTTINHQTDKVHNRVVRFTADGDTAKEQSILIDNIPALKGYHSGGALAFGPDDKLYVTVGDATEHEFAQDPNIVIGKVLRINRDGSIPEDNPFPNSPVFTLGHRNTFGIAFDENGIGLMTENGNTAYDEINRIVKGGNYGFPVYQKENEPPELSDPSLSIYPIRSYRSTIAPTQMIYYQGDRFPDLKGKFIFGTFTGDLYALRINPSNGRIITEERIDLRPKIFTPVNGLAQSPAGDIYFGSYSIESLGSISEEASEIHFPLEIMSSDPSVRVNKVDLRVDERQLLLTIGKNEITPNENSLTSNETGTTFTLEFSSTLMDNVTSVINDQGEPQSFENLAVNGSSSDDRKVTISDFDVDRSSVIIISSAYVVPEFPMGILFVIVATLISVAIIMSRSRSLGVSKAL